MKTKEAAQKFLANKRIAVTGVSRQPKGHGSNAVYVRLRERGYEVFAVNPNSPEAEGDQTYPDLASIPGGVDAVVIGTRPEHAEDLHVGENRRNGIETSRERFADQGQVRFNPVVFLCQKLACPSQPRLDLVQYENHAVLLANGFGLG